jgi:hypothetical protein
MTQIRKSADAAVKRVVETAEQAQDRIIEVAEEAKDKATKLVERIPGRSRRPRKGGIVIAAVGIVVAIAAGVALSQLLLGKDRRWLG